MNQVKNFVNYNQNGDVNNFSKVSPGKRIFKAQYKLLKQLILIMLFKHE